MAPAFGFGFSSATGRGSAVKPNGSPSNLVLTAITDTTAAGTFTSTSTNQDGYKLFKSTDGITYTEHSAVTFGTLSFAATGLISGTKYWLYVCAYKGSALSTASNDVVIEAETTTYYARVVADGGTLIDASKVNEDLTAIKAIDETASIVMLMSGHGGMKRNDNGGLIETSKLYDYFNSSVDSSQATSANRPISALLSNSIHNLFFGPELTNKRLIHSPILSSNYTAFYVLQKGIAGPATAAEYFHAGNISGGAIGFMSNYYYESVGITSYMSSKKRASSSFPTDQNCHVITMQPDHIYKDGSEISYKTGYEGSMTGGSLTSIGGHPITNNLGHTGELGFILIFNKILDNSKRIVIENHLAKYATKTYLPNYSELSYHIWHQKGDEIFAADIINNKLLYSSNNGTTFTELSFANSVSIQMGYIFANGTILFCTDKKVYKSANHLASISEITPLDLSGNAYSPTENYENFQASNKIYSQILASGDELIAFGNYTTDDAPVIVWYSINGVGLKMAYRFGTSYDYDARHIHNCIFVSSTGEWYVTTGDSSTQIHWVKGTFNEGAGTWTWTFVVNGSDTNQYKCESLQVVDGIFYWGGDMTNGNNANGLWHCAIGNEATIGNHVRDFAYIEETSSLLVENDRMLFVTWNKTPREWDLFIYDRTTKLVKQYFLDLALDRPAPGYTKWLWQIEKIRSGEYMMQMYKYGDGSIYNTIKFYI